MASVKKLVIVPIEEWLRLTKDRQDVMEESVHEIECGSIPPPPPPPQDEEEVVVEGDRPPPPPPPKGQEGGEEGKEGKDTELKARKKRWGPPGRPVHPTIRRKWIHI